MQRWQPAKTLLIALVLACSASAQEAGPAKSGAMAILIRNPEQSAGAPPFALADQFGVVQRLVEPTPGIDLASRVGQRVRIADDTGRTLLASQLTLTEPAAARPPRELRAVSPAQFIPPRRTTRAFDSRAPSSADRKYAVVRAQAAAPADASGERSLGDFGGDLPGPAPTEAGPVDPLQLDELAPPAGGEELAPIAPGSRYYEELPPMAPVHAGPPPSHAADCPHCNKPEPAPCGDDCPHCQAKVAPPVNLCSRCDGAAGWCGPTCCPPSQRGPYGRIEYLLWWFDEMETPPLVTQNDNGAAPILGQPGTRTIYGGELGDGPRDGLRITLGAWLDDCRNFGVEGDWSEFETETDVFSYSDYGARFAVGRPFYNITPVQGGAAEDVQVISVPDQVIGDLSIIARSKFRTGGLRLRTGICCRDLGGCGPCGSACGDACGPAPRPNGISRIDFLIGYRHADLEEQLTFQEFVEQESTGGNVQLSEAFQVDNDFHGLDLGFVYEWRAGRWGLELLSRVALGSTSQQVNITGFNSIGIGDTTVLTTPGGLYTQASNLGTYERERFSVLPELSARVSYFVTPRLSVNAAYTVLYWANVVRPGDQIDRSVDGRLVGGAEAPGFGSHPRLDLDETSLWAHGLNLGVDYRY